MVFTPPSRSEGPRGGTTVKGVDEDSNSEITGDTSGTDTPISETQGSG